MDELKHKITEAPVLVSLYLRKGAGQIVVNVDTSTTVGWRAALSRIQERESCTLDDLKAESGLKQKKYDALKLECRELLKALKKFSFWLYGRYFTVKTDSQKLVW